ncbi:MAG: HAD-IIA family hydrolase [Acidimicrobiia bacterium]
MRDSFLATDQRPGNVVFDLDGVIFLGAEAISGAGAALAAIAASGTNVIFATNNATKTTDHVANRIAADTGFAAPPQSIATAATSVAEALGADDDPILVVGESGLVETLVASGRTITADASSARSVVVGLDRDITYDKLEQAATAIRRGARFIATNTDVTFPMPWGPVPGAGAIVAAIAAASESTPEVTGKPHQPMVRHISHLLGPGDTWVVGDRPETDLALARAAGWKAVLTLTGITRSIEDVPQDLQPDLVIESIADLTEMFR